MRVPCRLLLPLVFAVGCSTGNTNIAPREDYQEVTARLTILVEHERADKALPALSIVLVDDQETVWAQGFGYADPEDSIPATARTTYRVGSVSKRLLRSVMESEGFTVYEWEWWHFDYGDWSEYPILNRRFEEIVSR
jgi:D-alanyl-D-alanine dipeptidase